MQFTYSNSNNYLAGAKEVNDISTNIYNTSRQTGVNVNQLIETERKARATKTDAKNTAEVLTAPGSLMDVIMEVANQFPDLKEDLLRGIQEREIAIAIDEMITENDPTTRVDPGAEIRLLPAIAGGNK